MSSRPLGFPSARPLLPYGSPSSASHIPLTSIQTSAPVSSPGDFERNDAAHEEGNTQDVPIETSSRPLLPSSSSPASQYIKWGLDWKTPAYMLALISCGIALSLGHHFYFAFLDGSVAGDSSKQQWATQFGTAFSFLIIALLKSAIDEAYSQYLWTLLRRKAYSFETLDKLFSLTSNPFGFLDLSLLGHAKGAVLVAVACWSIALGGITPPATLSIVPGLLNSTRETWLPSFDWNLGKPFIRVNGNEIPTSLLLDIATQTAEESSIVALTPPAPNSSFSLQFYGPAVQCAPPSSDQKTVFDYYANRLTIQMKEGNDEGGQYVMIVTGDTFMAGNLTWNISGTHEDPTSTNNPQMLVLSAFAPFEGYGGWLADIDTASEIDQYNNWKVDLPYNFKNENLVFDSVAGGMEDDVYQQLWVQTSNDSFVCVLGNASYNADFEFVNGAQSSVQYSTSNFTELIVPLSGLSGYNSYATESAGSYMGYWVAFTSLISGNITISLTDLVDTFPGNMSFVDSSSKALLSGLGACNDIIHNYWEYYPVGAGANGPILASDPAYSAYQQEALELAITLNITVYDDLFDNPVGHCRNGTLIRAIEDLAINITMSMLSSVNLTSPNTTLVNVTYFETNNIYQYNSRNLILSYSIAIFVTLVSLLIGFYALHENGVVHSTSFSAIVATTRTPELAVVCQGQGLGAEPIDKRMAKVRLRFGELVGSSGSLGKERQVSSVGFGPANGVKRLKNGGKYV